MGSQNNKTASTGEALSAESAAQIKWNRIVLSPVDPFYDFYMRYGSMKNALELHKKLNQQKRDSNQP
ncbi:hypothetical protein SAMN05421720_12412 [Rhodospira trueperi]|uniref:Uncharacterized protein n=2 Tax=Rhodospira trueperi TaxID=69960 RepID=A0A1G7HRM9_9PROT|nr:hypothetical protein SAMN05421720_12412 [Rhodospira trueperi]